MQQLNLESYLSNGVENIVKGIVRTSAKSPQTMIFMMQYAMESKKAENKRKEAEERGEHVPPFLIASITNRCNLHCKGCYARANHSCIDGKDGADEKMLTAVQWESIFEQAGNLGVGFILLAGGEPFGRKDVLQAAAAQKKILFPIFTNGTMIDEEYERMLSKNPNLIPVLSIEGNEEMTDGRRGDGIYRKLLAVMERLKENRILFGASVTVHKDNLEEVLSDTFIEKMQQYGCKAVIYVEYVPMDKKTANLALDEACREKMMDKLNRIRSVREGMLFIAFPGDEKSSGGCLAAGRGFFHINAYGGAEPCPFSPYSDVSLKDVSLKEALYSPLFRKLQTGGDLVKEHIGGCVLFEQEERVKKLLEEEYTE